ncbi:uncharacterized protein BO97DRAFT_426435 [Aspergillus homomorphus CBS 101889]|uniref:Uncharacterized protein n=1 Tax=Aspergillus homomorphus (strain CBS 101889) TaxID=1450537 RepID=A0A395HUA9_ASPHC|nr:hypothetical protein BO97DRAFT_426435 [Aspergillus homomorphus CBS 101889]RAL10418.1 hypothetical protein BO97DRAFT_426435 [Aspergillus homomorphus CBS 101889]
MTRALNTVYSFLHYHAHTLTHERAPVASPAHVRVQLDQPPAFTINNQCQPASIEEDRLNKSWRPLPAGRLSAGQARVWGLVSTVLAVTVSTSSNPMSTGSNLGQLSDSAGNANGSDVAFGGSGGTGSALLALLRWIYNDLGQGNGNWAVRNMLTGEGFTSIAAGTLELALQVPLLSLSSQLDHTNMHLR